MSVTLHNGKKQALLNLGEDCGAFHYKCGKSIVFRERRLIAECKQESAIEGVVLSEKPIPAGVLFQVKILKRRSIISIGFTSQDPDDLKLPKVRFECLDRKNIWMLERNTMWCGGDMMESSKLSTDALVTGDSVAVCVNAEGILEYWVNGKCKGNVGTNLPHKLWGMVEVRGGGEIQSQFHFGAVIERQMMYMQGRFSTLEVEVLQLKAMNTEEASASNECTGQEKISNTKQTQDSDHSQGPAALQTVEVKKQVELLTKEVSKLQEENGDFVYRIESQLKELSDLLERNQQLATVTQQCKESIAQFEQQLKMQLAEQKKVIQEEIGRKLQEHFRKVGSQTQSPQTTVDSDEDDYITVCDDK
jgi:predicted house-cleaning noncanonical NTP pyrophosphatase (MazG superfamily)